MRRRCKGQQIKFFQLYVITARRCGNYAGQRTLHIDELVRGRVERIANDSTLKVLDSPPAAAFHMGTHGCFGDGVYLRQVGGARLPQFDTHHTYRGVIRRPTGPQPGSLWWP